MTLNEIVPLGNSDKDTFITLALHFERLSHQSANPVYKDANNNTPATEKQKKYLSKLIDATRCEDVPPLDEISKKDAGIWIGKLSKQAKDLSFSILVREGDE